MYKLAVVVIHLGRHFQLWAWTPLGFDWTVLCKTVTKWIVGPLPYANLKNLRICVLLPLKLILMQIEVLFHVFREIGNEG